MRRFALLTTALAVLAAGAQAAPGEEPLRVVTTLGFLADLAHQVGGDLVQAESLVDAQQDPHYVSPTPVLMRRAREADVLVEVGLQLELWIDNVVSGSGNARIQSGQPGRVIASQGVPVLQLPQVLSREWGDVHPYGNPHVWLDPLNAKTMAENIADALSKVDPAHAETYAGNLEAFQARIDEALFGPALVERLGGRKLTRLARTGRLDEYLQQRELADQLGGWLLLARPLAGRPVVTYHRTYIYLAERFGFEIAETIEEKPGIPPSARQRDKVLALMRERGVRTILEASYYERSAADYLAERTGARVVAAANDVGDGADDYLGMIDRILRDLVASETAAER